MNATVNGVPLHRLQKWMGHARLTTTVIYADAVGKEEQNIAARMWGRDMHLIRSEPGANLRRFYRVELVQGLFGDWGLARNWGRVGSPGQLRADWFNTKAEAVAARFDLQVRKAKRGYK